MCSNVYIINIYIYILIIYTYLEIVYHKLVMNKKSSEVERKVNGAVSKYMYVPLVYHIQKIVLERFCVKYLSPYSKIWS